MIKLGDLIEASGIKLQNFKIHCATGQNPTPLEEFFDGKFEEWQASQTKPNFRCDQIVALINTDRDKWLFAGVFKVHGEKTEILDNRTWYVYSTSELKGLEHLTGRAIVDFEKKFRQSYLIGEKYIENLIVSEIRPQKMSVGDFPGYNSVLLSNKLLKTIVRENLSSWKSAMSNVAGIYVIVDNQTGKQYVGCAHGGEGIWQRWVSYANNRHGGNKELKKVMKEKGHEYVKNFQYSILEVCDINSNDEYIFSREGHWKNVLLSREFGYNSN